MSKSGFNLSLTHDAPESKEKVGTNASAAELQPSTTSNDKTKSISLMDDLGLLDCEMEDVDACLNGDFDDDLLIDINADDNQDILADIVEEELVNVPVPIPAPAKEVSVTRAPIGGGNIFGNRVDFSSGQMLPPKQPQAPTVTDTMDTASTSGRSTGSSAFTASTVSRSAHNQNWRIPPKTVAGERSSDIPKLGVNELINDWKTLDEKIKSGQFKNELMQKKLAGSKNVAGSSLSVNTSSKARTSHFNRSERNPYPKAKPISSSKSEPISLVSQSNEQSNVVARLIESGLTKEIAKDFIENFGEKYNFETMKKIAEIQKRPLSYTCNNFRIMPTQGKGIANLKVKGHGTGKSLNMRFA